MTYNVFGIGIGRDYDPNWVVQRTILIRATAEILTDLK